jgi:hypothetical protein
MNPLQKLFEDIDAITEQLKNKQADFMFGCFTTEARNRIMSQITSLKAKKEALENKLPRVQDFFAHYSYYSTGAPYLRPTKKKDLEPYIYFYDHVDYARWQHSPDDKICEYCKRAKTSRTGVVFTLDPLYNELVDICSNCYINRKNKTQK